MNPSSTVKKKMTLLRGTPLHGFYTLVLSMCVSPLSRAIFFLSLAWATPGHSEILAPTVPLPPALTRNYDLQAYDLTLTQFEKTCDDKNCKLWAEYMRGGLWASQDPKKSCETFTKLEDNDDFPLYPLVLINQIRSCKPTSKEMAQALFKKINEYIDDKKPKRWLQSALVDATIPVADLLGPETYVTQSLLASQLSRSRKNKVLYLQNALNQAQKISPARFAEIQKELYKLAPRLNPAPDDFYAVALDAAYNHEHEQAIKAFEKVLKLKNISVIRRRATFESLKLSYKAIQKKPEALFTAKRLNDFDFKLFKTQKASGDTPKNLLASGMSLARFLWTEHQDKKALALLTRLEKTLKKKTPTGDLNFVRSLIFQEQGKMKSALKQMELAFKNQDPKNKTQYQWFYAWLNFKLKNYDAAISMFNILLGTEQDLGKRAQETFWLGKAYQATKQLEAAKAKFEELLNNDPLSYYSLLAYRELGLTIPKPSASNVRSFTRIPKKISQPREISWTLFNWLISVRELSLARQFLDEEAPLPDVGLEDWQNIFQQYAQAGSYAAIFSKISKLSIDEKQKILVETPGFLFPTPYKELVDSASARTGLWTEYIFSIMRQESSFDTLSVSPANAFGLLQILPLIAKQLNRPSGLYKEPQDLLDPVVNITLGAQHLRNYWDLFNGQFVMATAAYNASPEAVKQWVAKRFNGNPLVFIEDIPYEETRTYVKLVIRNFINYLRLNSGEDGIAFPEWCLEDIQPSKE